jgi:hypothetical protein
MAPVAFFILRDTRYFLNWTLVLDTVPHLSDLLPKRIELSMQKNWLPQTNTAAPLRHRGSWGPHGTWTLAHICLKKLLGSNDVHIQSPSARKVIQRQKQLAQLHFILQSEHGQEGLCSFIPFAHTVQEHWCQQLRSEVLWVDQGTVRASSCDTFWLLSPIVLMRLSQKVFPTLRMLNSSDNNSKSTDNEKCDMLHTILINYHVITNLISLMGPWGISFNLITDEETEARRVKQHIQSYTATKW